jgi:chromosome segregation ATPase
MELKELSEKLDGIGATIESKFGTIESRLAALETKQAPAESDVERAVREKGEAEAEKAAAAAEATKQAEARKAELDGAFAPIAEKIEALSKDIGGRFDRFDARVAKLENARPARKSIGVQTPTLEGAEGGATFGNLFPWGHKAAANDE